jgi:putative FmdB family regulatory protein
MPTYEFRCSNGHAFDEFHKISDAPSTATCPVCGAEAQRAISGGAGLVFKGSGFYLTDYGKNAHRSSPPAKTEGGSSESGKSQSTKSESAAPSSPAAPSAKSGGESGGSTKGTA